MPNLRLARLGVALPAIALIAGCVQSTGGAGTTSKNEPVAAQAVADASSGRTRIELISPGRWTCSGDYSRADVRGSIHTVPIRCLNGMRGQIVLSANQFQQQVTASFRLSNGESGTVTFGLT